PLVKEDRDPVAPLGQRLHGSPALRSQLEHAGLVEQRRGRSNGFPWFSLSIPSGALFVFRRGRGSLVKVKFDTELFLENYSQGPGLVGQRIAPTPRSDTVLYQHSSSPPLHHLPVGPARRSGPERHPRTAWRSGPTDF